MHLDTVFLNLEFYSANVGLWTFSFVLNWDEFTIVSWFVFMFFSSNTFVVILFT